ncbi:MFS transporter [bacterium]|nr:MFS transporter [bacterium]
MRSRPFIALYIAVLVATMGISMVSPLLPVYAKDLGANGVWLGLTFSVFAIVQTFVGPFAGRLSDKFGRKPFIILGLAIYIIAAVGYLTAENFYQVIGRRYDAEWQRRPLARRVRHRRYRGIRHGTTHRGCLARNHRLPFRVRRNGGDAGVLGVHPHLVAAAAQPGGTAAARR